MEKTIKWGVLGPGFIAHAFARSFPNQDNCELYAVGAMQQEMADDYAQKFNIPKAYGTYEGLIGDPDVDAIYIATPTSVHYQYIMACLKARKHVLCEKTITMNAAQLEDCIKAAKANNVILTEGLTSVFEPVMYQMKKKIDSGMYGKLQFITVTCGSLKEYDATNRYFSPQLGGGAIFDIGCYAIGFANYFMSSMPEVIKSEGVICDTGVDLKSAYVLRNQEDELATVVISLRSKTEKIGIIACEDAFVRIEGFIRGSKATVTYFDGRTEVYEFPVRQLEAEVEALNKDIRAGNDECELCPSSLSLSILKVMDEAREQWGYQFDFEKEAAND